MKFLYLQDASPSWYVPFPGSSLELQCLQFLLGFHCIDMIESLAM